jgi:hypothetical protein
VLRDPWEATGLVLGMLEKISESAKGATKGIFGDCDSSEDEYLGQEKSELLKDTEEALSKVLRTLTKIFAEPFKTKDDEINEVVGKPREGAIEFVLKPVVGMPHLALLTTRGIEKGPKTIYLNTNKFIKKKDTENNPPYQFNIQKRNITVHMEKGFNVVVDERALKREIIEAFKKQEENIKELIIDNSKPHIDTINRTIPANIILKHKTLTELKTSTKLPMPEGELIDKEFYHVDEFGNDESVNSEDCDDYSRFVTVEDLQAESPRSVLSDEEIYEETHIIRNPTVTHSRFTKSSLISPLEELKANSLQVDEKVEETKVIRKIERRISSCDKAKEILEKARVHSYSKYKDEYRVPPADKVGGLPLIDKKVTEILRGVATEYLKQFFSRILRGNFNLTRISFPIKCMRPVSILETFGLACMYNPIYLSKAALLIDPIEQCKYMITSQISSYHLTSSFLKPVIFVCYI